jgi:hypothetical protein
MPVSKLMKWLLIANIVIWVFQSILWDLEIEPKGATWIWFSLVTFAKAWIASQISIIIVKQPEPIS